MNPKKSYELARKPVRDRLKPEDLERYNSLPFEEVVASMADTQKIDMADAVLNQITTTGDPSSLKILQGILERQGYSTEKELPITDERFKEIILTVAASL